MDVIGPVQDKGPYRYMLTIVDSCTRWPWVFLLKSLTAKAVCDALLNLFSQVGICSVIISDNGTNFTSQLTQQFMKLFGCSPRFLTPYHPQGSGLVERFNSTFKSMLHHVIRDHPGTWHKLIPLLVWSLREMPNATTGLTPYQLVYGRLPKGVLSLIKDNWAGEVEVPPNLSKTAGEYLAQLKHNLELSAQYADEHAKIAQQRYANQYNLRARDKRFDEGESVIILTPDSTNKLYSRWRMGIIAKVLSPHSYLVDLENGGRKHVHANHMRKYITRVHTLTVGVINDDEEFGRNVYPPS
jgi:transposase InsO family protein